MGILSETKNILDEEIKKKIQKIINEELSINVEVDNLTNKLYVLFLTEFQKIKFKKINDNVSFANLIFKNVDIFGTKFLIKIACYNTDNKHLFNEMVKKYNCYNAITDFTNKSITINIGVLSTTKFRNFESILQHEIEHVFQMSKKGKLNNYKQGIKNNIYNNALKILNNQNNYTPYQFKCAFLLYFLSDNEVDAFINQLYKDLVNGTLMDEETIVANSTIMKYYKTSKKLLSEININNVAYMTALYSLGIKTTKDRNWFVKYCKNALKRTITKIGKVIVKARNKHDNFAIQLNDLIVG